MKKVPSEPLEFIMLDQEDFTKEELGEIFWIIEGCTMDYIGKENNVLINKIQSMIDNYDANVIDAWQCEKCGHVQ